jgi:hypothetical protein
VVGLLLLLPSAPWCGVCCGAHEADSCANSSCVWLERAWMIMILGLSGLIYERCSRRHALIALPAACECRVGGH